MARTRTNRIAGLGYAAVGTVMLVASLPPPSARQLAAAIVGFLALGAALAWVFRREPWLVAFLSLAVIPIRVHYLHQQLLVPLYVVAAGAGFASPAEDPRALAGSVLRLKGLSQEDRRRMGDAGRAYYDRHFQPRVLAESLVSRFRKLTIEEANQ